MTNYVSAFGFTAKDLAPKNVRTDMNPNNDNKIRRSWVLHAPTTVKNKLAKVDQELRFELYSIIDRDVSDKWIELMRKHTAKSIEAGAKIVMDKTDCLDRLEDQYCVDSDEHLLQAGEQVAMSLVDYLDTLPESIQKQMNA